MWFCGESRGSFVDQPVRATKKPSCKSDNGGIAVSPNTSPVDETSLENLPKQESNGCELVLDPYQFTYENKITFSH